ncbi:MAG: hypothetical protein A3D10_02680 [Omnitrophica WOR_2 bacterium RIFCSPHIGHO2_02_FULL_48_11]|nr:MAG: hypothetical protein A3D10_02680 [Omnitrophica WOR_2 bacterium RIFCSPHIGHO2_02_FULL_48_11]
MLALSTAWNYREDMSVPQMLEDIKATGIRHLELGYRLTQPQVEALIPLLKKFKLKVSSVHNYCPLPFDGLSPRHSSNYYRLSALQREERELAIKWTNHSIDTALRVGAQAVVIHAGAIELEHDPSPQLFQMYREGKAKTPEFENLRSQLLKARQEKQKDYLKVLVESLKEVMAYAQKKNMKIGLETRYYPVEIPNIDEIGFFLDLFGKQGMSYWHDVGHGEVNERLGFASPLSYLKKYADRMIGWHIHGVKVLKDHHAPFDGDFDLQKVVPFMKKEHIKVIESHSLATAEQIKEAVKRLEKI